MCSVAIAEHNASECQDRFKAVESVLAYVGLTSLCKRITHYTVVGTLEACLHMLDSRLCARGSRTSARGCGWAVPRVEVDVLSDSGARLSRPWCSVSRPCRSGTCRTAVASTVLRKRCCGTSLKQSHSNFRGIEPGPRSTVLAMTLLAWAPEYRRNSSGPRSERG